MDVTITADRETGKFEILKGYYDLNGGGRANFSFSVAQVCATAAQSSYYFPKSDLAAAAFATPAVESGSMRGYGTLQSMTMTELMVDELAAELDMDAIELRRRNVLLPQYPNTQGAVQLGDPRLEEMLEKAAEHPLWKEKDQKKAELTRLTQATNKGWALLRCKKPTGQ